MISLCLLQCLATVLNTSTPSHPYLDYGSRPCHALSTVAVTVGSSRRSLAQDEIDAIIFPESGSEIDNEGTCDDSDWNISENSDCLQGNVNTSESDESVVPAEPSMWPCLTCQKRRKCMMGKSFTVRLTNVCLARGLIKKCASDDDHV